MASATEEYTMSPEKERKFEEFAMMFKDDPDFYRIPFPEHILKRLGLYREKKDISAVEAVKRCLDAPNVNVYTNNTIEVIDQSVSVSHFPNLLSLVDSTGTSETKTQEPEGRPSSPALSADVSITLSA
jgi:hypothetical protein